MTDAAPPPPGTGWWHRRILIPVRQQLIKGTTPDRLSLTLALGVTLTIFPILGTGLLLRGLAAWGLKLNQPIIQSAGTLAYPLQLLLLLPFYRAGEMLFNIPPIPLAIPDLIARFFENAPQFFRDYGMTGVRGILVWILIAPFLLTGLYFSLRPLLRRSAAIFQHPPDLPAS